MLLSARLSIDISDQGVDAQVTFDERSALECATAILPSSKPSGRCACCVGTVSGRRLHGTSLAFVDLVCTDAPAVPRMQIIVEGSALYSAVAGLAFRLGSTVAVVGTCGRSRRGEFSLYATAVSLLRLPPEPTAALRASQAVACGIMCAADAAAALGCAAEEVEELVQALARAQMDPTDPECVQACRQLTAALRGGGGRIRPPRFNGVECALLARLQAAHCSVQVERCESLMRLDEDSLGALHPDHGMPEGMEAEDRTLRARYLREKKLPQLRWMLQQAFEVLSARASAVGGRRLGRVLDVGCGKADLALLLAAQMPRLDILCADTNSSALAFARRRAAAAGLQNVSFFHGDASQLAPHPDPQLAPHPDPQALAHRDGRSASAEACCACTDDGDGNGDGAGPVVDLLIGLHACGGLSDVALSIAARHGASALVCCCCYNKHRALCTAECWGVEEAEKTVLCRMADSCDRGIAEPARQVVGCLRLAAFRRACKAPASLAIRTFPEAYSAQNVVLVAHTQ